MTSRRWNLAERLQTLRRRRALQARVALGQWRGPVLPPEPPDADLLARGAQLQAEVLARHAGVRAGCGERVLLVTPPSLAGEVWFGDLARALQHVGVATHRVPASAGLTPELVADFRPTLLLGLETEGLQRQLQACGLDRPSRCTRLLIPTRDAPGTEDPLTPAEQQRLARTAAGAGADLLLSLHAEPFMRRTVEPWLAAGGGRPLVWLPQAACPFRDRPLAVPRVHAYAHLSVANPDRVHAVWQTLRGLLGRHRGLFGERETWGFGQPRQGIEAHARSQAQARISLAPLVAPLLDVEADLTQRVYAAAASGTFQITTLSPLTRQHFDADELVAVVPTSEAFEGAFERYLDDPAARQQVARRALERAYREHTSLHRAVQLIDTVQALRG